MCMLSPDNLCFLSPDNMCMLSPDNVCFLSPDAVCMLSRDAVCNVLLVYDLLMCVMFCPCMLSPDHLILGDIKSVRRLLLEQSVPESTEMLLLPKCQAVITP